MVQISLQNSGGKVVFYGWVPRNPPWAPTGVKVPWSLKCYDLAKNMANFGFYHTVLTQNIVGFMKAFSDSPVSGIHTSPGNQRINNLVNSFQCHPSYERLSCRSYTMSHIKIQTSDWSLTAVPTSKLA